MSLPTAIVAVLSLTTPDVCTTARETAEAIAQARDARVPLVRILEAVEFSSFWIGMAAIIYEYPDVPPVAVGVSAERACREEME